MLRLEYSFGNIIPNGGGIYMENFVPLIWAPISLILFTLHSPVTTHVSHSAALPQAERFKFQKCHLEKYAKFQRKLARFVRLER